MRPCLFPYKTHIVFIECKTPSIPDLDEWFWEASHENGKNDSNGRKSRGYISATFDLGSNGDTPDTIKFGWYTDAGEVSRQNEVLLQLVVDEVGSKSAL